MGCGAAEQQGALDDLGFGASGPEETEERSRLQKEDGESGLEAPTGHPEGPH